MPKPNEPSTELTAELAALRRENAILRETLDAIDGTVVVYDSQRRYVIGNRAYHEHFPHLPPDETLAGMLFEEVLGLSIDAGTVSDPSAYIDRAAFLARRVQELERGEIAPREVYESHRGKWYLLRAKLTPSRSRVALRVDIDEQKRLQLALAAAREASEAASRAKSLFLANTGHELRTPLNAIINFSRLLEEQIHGPLGAPDYLEYAQTIRESGLHLLSLIEELLDVARGEAGQLVLREQPVSLRTTILSVCRLLAPDAQETGVALRTEVPPDLPAVRGDAMRLRQVVTNLVANAIKFCNAGDTVTVSAQHLIDGGIMVSIVDTGPGIEDADLARVMRPFERAQERARRSRPGLGLGLPLAKHLVALHGGDLVLESVPGHGTTARVYLPADRVLSGDTTESASNRVASAAAPGADEGAAPQRSDAENA